MAEGDGIEDKWYRDDPASHTLHEELLTAKLWGNIHRKALTDPGLQDLIDRVIMYYKLSEENKPK